MPKRKKHSRDKRKARSTKKKKKAKYLQNRWRIDVKDVPKNVLRH